MNKSFFRLLLFTFVIAAAAFRFAFFIFGLWHMPISTDEAWPALMGLHVLKGDFPVFYWGQNYMGSQQAFFDAFVFTLLGVNTFATRIYPFLFSLIYVAATYLLARRIYDKNVALITLALLVIPVPYLTMAGTLSVPPEYLALTAMGSLALVLLAGITLSPNSEKPFLKIFFLLGLLLGFMFWLHLVAISYIIVALVFIFLRDKLCFLRSVFWLFVLAFFIGSFPFWWFNFTHDFITFADMTGTGNWHSAWELCRALFRISLHFMIGMKIMLYGDSCHFVSLPLFTTVVLGVIWCFVIILVIGKSFRGMLRWLKWPTGNLAAADSIAGRRPTGADGTAILLALAVLIFYFFCRSERSSWASVRFILPIMSVLPVLLACGAEHIRNKSRFVFTILLAFIIIAQAWGNILLAREWNKPEIVGKKLELPDTAQLHAFLRSKGITHAYAHYWISYRITFESREELICAEPYNERFPDRPAQYLEEVHAATNIAFITHPTLRFVPNFEKHLIMLGGTYKKDAAGDFTIFYDIVPPYGKTDHVEVTIKLREIKRDGWRFIANQRQDLLNLITDDNPETRWETGAPQKAGDQIMIDMIRAEKICKIRFDLTGVESDTPNGYQLEVSLDGKEWKKVYEYGAVASGFFWENDQPWMYIGNNYFTAAFAPIECQYIRMTLTEGHSRFWWSIGELRVFGPE